jgi:hypothetical protein
LLARHIFLDQTSWQVMRVRFVLGLLASLAAAVPVAAQDLAPRAYVITPVHSNAITITESFYDGGVDFNGTVPIGDATGTYHVSIFSFYHSMNFFGRSANLTASLPYAAGNFQGQVSGQATSIYRSGLLDSGVRFSVNLMGGPAMQPKEMVKWKQKRLLGVSLKVIAPTGQYSGTKLGQQSMGFQAGHWILRTLWSLGTRWICRGVVLHHKLGVLCRLGRQTTE